LVPAPPIAGAGTGHATSKPFVTCGIFIGKIEEGARVFAPTRLLPFEHPEALGHQFPTALELHQSEYDILVFIGETVGLKLQMTLQRYPTQPISVWKYPDFEIPPAEEVKQADTLSLNAKTSPVPGLRVIAYKNSFPLSFIVDTRHLDCHLSFAEQMISMISHPSHTSEDKKEQHYEEK